MNREYYKIYSPVLSIDIPILRFGSWGKPVVMIGTSCSKFYDIENNGVIADLEPRINAGEFQVFCIQSTDEEHLYKSNFFSKIKRYDELLNFYAYVAKEVFPWIRNTIGSTEKKTLVGYSLGGYHALNLALSYPNDIEKIIGCGSAIKIGNYIHDPTNAVRTYLENGLSRSLDIEFILGCGEKDYLLEQNKEMILLLKELGYNSELVTNKLGHDWDGWRQILSTEL